MTALEEARRQKSVLYARYKEVRAAVLETRDPAERRRQNSRAKLLLDMYRDACAEVNRLDPNAGPKRAPAARPGNGQGGGLDVLLQSGTFWSDIEGHTFSALQGERWDGLESIGGRQAKLICSMVAAGLEKCTPRQREYIQAHYADGTAMTEIAADHGVDLSTVSRVIKNGLGRVERYVTAKLLLTRCVDGQGRFDYLTFVNSAQVLTQRQRELMFLMLARDTSYLDMSAYIDRCPSTVSRTADRVEERLRGLAVELDVKYSAVKVRRQDWESVTEKELAQRLGLSPMFYYQTVCRGQEIGGIPLLHYVILRRLRETGDHGWTAAELGCSARYVRQLERQYSSLPALPEADVEPYRPERPRRVKPPQNPFVAVSGDAIIDRIDAKTYLELKKRFGV